MAHHTRRHGARSPSHALASSTRIVTSKSDTCCSRVVAIWRCWDSPPPKMRRCMRESSGVCVEGGGVVGVPQIVSQCTNARACCTARLRSSSASRRSPGLSPAQAVGGLICCLQRGQLSPQTERSTRLTHASSSCSGSDRRRQALAAHARQRETQVCVCACAHTCGLSVHVVSVLCVSVQRGLRSRGEHVCRRVCSCGCGGGCEPGRFMCFPPPRRTRISSLLNRPSCRRT